MLPAWALAPDLILNWFRARGQFSSGVVEGFNGKARVITHGRNVPTSGAQEVALISIGENQNLPTDFADEAEIETSAGAGAGQATRRSQDT